MGLRVSNVKQKNTLTLAMLFLATMNFYAKFFYLAFGALLFLGLAQRRLLIKPTIIPYALLSLLMSIYNQAEGIPSMIRCFACLVLYVVGYNLVAVCPGTVIQQEQHCSHAQRMAGTILLVVSGGSFVHYLLNFVTNMGLGMGRNTRDIWSGQIMAATGQATLSCLMLGLSVSMMILPWKKIHRYMGSGCIIMILAYNLVLAGRTLLVVMFVLAGLGLCYFFATSRSRNERMKLGLQLAALAVVLWMAYFLDVGGIQGTIGESNLLTRFDLSLEGFFSVDARTNSKVAFLQHFWEHPLGGMYLREEYGYAHDLLLDGYDEYGLGALVLLVWILLSGWRKLARILRYSGFARELKLAILCVYASIMMFFAVEPIFAGMQWLFACYCLINGCMEALLEASFPGSKP